MDLDLQTAVGSFQHDFLNLANLLLEATNLLFDPVLSCLEVTPIYFQFIM